jgi:predicted RNase H-like HicB family nuclease
MKIVIKKEPNGMYFAEIKGIEGVYAQWETLEEVVENLWSVYKEVMDLLEKQVKEDIKFKGNLCFKKLEITV